MLERKSRLAHLMLDVARVYVISTLQDLHITTPRTE
jgi:hypothetical protein